MQLYAGQEAGKPEMQDMKVNRGQVFDMTSLGSYAHSPSPLRRRTVSSTCGNRHSNLESIYVLEGSGSACAETAKTERIEIESRFIFASAVYGWAAGSHHSSLKARLTPDSFRSAVSNFS